MLDHDDATMVLTILSRIDDIYSPHVPHNAGVTDERDHAPAPRSPYTHDTDTVAHRDTHTATYARGKLSIGRVPTVYRPSRGTGRGAAGLRRPTCEPIALTIASLHFNTAHTTICKPQSTLRNRNGNDIGLLLGTCFPAAAQSSQVYKT